MLNVQLSVYLMLIVGFGCGAAARRAAVPSGTKTAAASRTPTRMKARLTIRRTSVYPTPFRDPNSQRRNKAPYPSLVAKVGMLAVTAAAAALAAGCGGGR